MTGGYAQADVEVQNGSQDNAAAGETPVNLSTVAYSTYISTLAGIHFGRIVSGLNVIIL